MTTTDGDKEECPGCGGSGVQTGNDGITIRCPICNGRGWFYRESWIARGN